MTVYRPKPEPWHESVPGTCQCHVAWAGRGMVDDSCWHHRLIEAIEELAAAGWNVSPPHGQPVRFDA